MKYRGVLSPLRHAGALLFAVLMVGALGGCYLDVDKDRRHRHDDRHGRWDRHDRDRWDHRDRDHDRDRDRGRDDRDRDRDRRR